MGLAGQNNEKLYLADLWVFPIVNYQRQHSTPKRILVEIHIIILTSYTYTESYSSTGVGVDARLVRIYRPNLNWRIGLAVHSPSFYYLKDQVSSTMVTNTEDYAGTKSVESATMDQMANVGKQSQIPAAFSLALYCASGSYIFPGQVTEGKMGFITADIEYQTNTSSKFRFVSHDQWQSTR